ncbi:glutamine-hydrolyzing carbamoyl-phosphate synthase small subunit [Candidatus Pacebacteria bacterium]|nr:glutamine-hydrolyzing carbamoyl-phosphate synthase small subunit [Candidatus Paceibacterota bacterium]
MQAWLVLKDGTIYEGTSFGYSPKKGETIEGEVVFNTGMTGYPETLTDPSYRGQILVSTYPLQGTYGIPDWDAVSVAGLRTHFESDAVHVTGLVVSEYQEEPSHFTKEQSLGAFLEEHRVPAISGIDTRAIVQKIREHGAMPGKIYVGTLPSGAALKTFSRDTDTEDLVRQVSIEEVTEYRSGSIRIVLPDTGCKLNIIRSLLQFDTTIIRVPHDYPFMDEREAGNLQFDALFIPNGPGNPALNKKLIAQVRKALEAKVDTFGICLGNQIVALAGGCQSKKLPYGHRGQNQPCRDVDTNHCIVTSQNHGFAVVEEGMPKNIKPWFVNVHDGSIEGVQFTDRPARAVQFHPESYPGPVDADYLFKNFIDSITK